MPLAALEHGVDWDWETFARVPRPARGRHRGQRRASSSVTVRSAATSWARRPSAARPPTPRSAPWSPSSHRDRGGRPRLLDHALQDALRRRRATRRLAVGERGRGARPLRRGRASTRGPRSRASSTAASTSSADAEIELFARMSAAGRPTAQLERPDGRLAGPRAGHPPALGGRPGGGARRARRRPDDARARPDEHELPHLLRALHAPGMERGDGPPGAANASRACATRRPVAWMDARANSRGGRRVPPPRRLGALRASGTPTRRRTRGSRAGPSQPSRPSGAPAPFDTLLDIVHRRRPPHDPLADRARRRPGSWDLRKQVWEDPRAMLGGSDAGAHLDRMCGAPYTTRFLGDMLRGRRLVRVERAVQMITSDPARALRVARPRCRRRRVPAPTSSLFDPATDRLRARHARRRPPGWHRAPDGRRHRGRARVRQRRGDRAPPTRRPERRPGTVLRSGRDTRTVSTTR